LIDEHPGAFAFVQYHVYDDYETAWAGERLTFYNPSLIPAVYFDGVIGEIGAQTYDVYHNDYESRHALPTDVTITLTAAPEDPATVSVSVQVCLEPTGGAKPMRVYIVQVLDHWPAEGGYHRNGFKQAAATEDISLAPGQCQFVNRTFTLDAESAADPDNVRIIAWAQAIQPFPAQVYQAALWPPDCNHNGVPDAEDIASGTSTDLNQDGIPDECEGLGDTDCSGATNFDDINPFVAALVDRAAYEARYPNCRWLNGDCNGDGSVDFDDINPFVALLVHG